MRIRRIEIHPVTLQLKEPFVIANETTVTAHNVLVQIEADDGTVGWGAAAPDIVTKETQKTILRALKAFALKVKGADPHRITRINHLVETVMPGNMAAKASVNIALYDLLGRSAGLPVQRMLGGYHDRILTSITIGIMGLEATVAKAEEHVRQGFRALKIKCGQDPQGDIARIRAVREAVGRDIALRLDANEGYSVESTLAVADALEDVDIEILEQPTRGDLLYCLKEVTARCSIPIMADESILGLEDSFKVAKEDFADLINIKLMKCGGITNAIKLNAVAESAGIEVMVGCMNESIVSVAAGAHFAMAMKNVAHADLDSHWDFVAEPGSGGIRFEDGYLYVLDEPGFGTKVDESKLRELETKVAV